MRATFKPGQAVVWESKNFNPDYWNKMPEEDRIKYYSWTGYGQGRSRSKVFVFICAILDSEGEDTGHCVLIDLDDGHVEKMRHTLEFRVATDEEL